MGRAELEFELGFDRLLIDGLESHSRKRPDFTGVEGRDEDWVLLEDGYGPIYRRAEYAIYARRG